MFLFQNLQITGSFFKNGLRSRVKIGTEFGECFKFTKLSLGYFQSSCHFFHGFDLCMFYRPCPDTLPPADTDIDDPAMAEAAATLELGEQDLRMLARLAEIATRCGETRSGVVEKLIREAEMPRPRTAGATRT